VSGNPDFARLAADYDRVRPVDANWWEVFELVVDEGDLRGRRVLDCGCGTGRLARALAESAGALVSGIDPESEMLHVARSNVPETVDLQAGRAEELPFPDRSFDRAALWLVCHLVDRHAAFRELARVLTADGCLVVVTFDPDHFGDFWLNALFPSLEAIDRARFPGRQELRDELDGAGFATVRFRRLSQRAMLTREQALERIESRHISTFDLLDPDEVRAGTERGREELPLTVEYGIEWLIAFGER
jgi:SAM-dependent methyltransferase